TRQISSSSRALLHEVVPYFDLLTHHVDRFVNDDTLLPSVRAAAKRARAILDRYYQKTDETFLNRASMVMDPRKKLSYFQAQEWPEEWVSEAVDLVKTEWRDNYKPRVVPAIAAATDRVPTTAPKPGRRSANAAVGTDTSGSAGIASA
ncbi:hypothetical protein OH76DRAFT_1364051, partial [Lentinus brumalis]